MPSYFPCPNNQCTYQFDADILPPAAMVTCPVCRTRFPYRAARAVPVGAEPAPDGLPEPVGMSAPPPPPAPPPAPAGPRLVNLREAPKSSVLPTILWVGGFAVVLALLVVGLMMRGRGTVENTTEARDEKFNLKVEPFPAPWETDVNAQRPVNGNILGRKRTGPDAFVAVAAQDHVDRVPRAAEVKEFMDGRLRGAFGTLEMEPIEGSTWARQPATAVRFTGTLEEEHVRGEAYAMTYKGIIYAYFTWAAEGVWESVGVEAAGLREKVQPAGFRDRWEPKKTSTQAHTLEGAGYQVEDIDGGVWIRAKPEDQWRREDRVKYILEDVKEIDPAATMAFRAEYRVRGTGDNKRKPAEAHALVVELPAGGDALAAVQEHVIERIKQDYAGGKAPDVKLEPMNRSPGGVALPADGPTIGRFLFRDPFDPRNPTMYVLSAITVGGKTVGVEAHCLERDASYLDEWMVHLAGSLKAR